MLNYCIVSDIGKKAFIKGGKHMFWIKTFILFLIFLASLKAGKVISKKYTNRVIELKEMKNALNMFLTKKKA